MTLIPITQAETLRHCPACNFAGLLKHEQKPCNYHTHPSMNYRNIPSGMCALRPEDRKRIERDYGVLNNGKLKSSWQDDLKKGFSECFRVLKQGGVLIFKWNETQIRVSEILKLSDVRPLFGNISGMRSNTHWICFMKPHKPADQKSA